MRKFITVLSLFLLFIPVCVLYAGHPGLRTTDLAERTLYRSERADSAHGFDVTKYEIYLTVNEQTHFVSGRVKAYVTAEETITSIPYNLMGLSVSEAKVNAAAVTFTHNNGIVTLPANFTAGQQFTTEVTYSGTTSLSPAPYNIGIIYGNNTCFTLSDPDASRYWWPCYDHPWDKAVVDLHITMRGDWLVACNGLRASIVDNGNGTKTHNWLGSNPMATYLACFTAGPYVEINQTAGDIPIQNFVQQSHYSAAATDFASLPQILQFYETQFGEYPFEKYGNAVVNMTTYGAMEHQTMTTLGYQFIPGNHSGEVTIAHELAHQWYGNSVTPLTFKDVWLSEGFATYAELLWTHHRFGWDSACAYLENSFHQYYINFENANSTLPNIIYDPPFNNYFYPQSYEKAASVLHMLRLQIGNAAFFQLLQNWYNTYHQSNVITAEFQAMAEQISGQDLTQFFQQWIYSRGIPSVEYTLMVNTQAQQGKVVGKTSCSTGTQFSLQVPFTATGLVQGDSLVFAAGPDGIATTFPLATGAPTYEVTAVDPNHWVLCRSYTRKDVSLTQCLPANNSVYLSWEEYSTLNGFIGYLVFRKTADQNSFSPVTDNPVNRTDFLDTGAVNGTEYFYMVQAVDNNGYRTLGSNVMSATPVAFAFDQGLLVVDETRDGTGNLLSPTDAAVDGFYTAALTPIAYTNWDYATQGAPDLNTLSHYPIVLWLADDYTQNLAADNLGLWGSYLLGNGKLVISGWKTPASFTPEFINSFMGNTDLIYDNGAVLTAGQSDDYPTLLPDPTKLSPTWNGYLSMVYTFESEGATLYTAQMMAGANGSGRQLAVRYDQPGTLVVFGIPLYYMQSAGVRGLLQLLLPELHHPLPADDQSGLQIPLSFTCSPNPFSLNQEIRCSKALPASGTILVYDVKGRLCRKIELSSAKTDAQTLVWAAVDDRGNILPSGIYMLQIMLPGSNVNLKVAHIKQ